MQTVLLVTSYLRMTIDREYSYLLFFWYVWYYFDDNICKTIVDADTFAGQIVGTI